MLVWICAVTSSRLCLLCSDVGLHTVCLQQPASQCDGAFYSVQQTTTASCFTSPLCPAHLCQATFVPCPLEALVPVWGLVRPKAPQPAQLLQLPGGGLPGEEHAAVQQTHRLEHGAQAQGTEHPGAARRRHPG